MKAILLYCLFNSFGLFGQNGSVCKVEDLYKLDSLVLIQVSSKEDFKDDHIPGALRVSRNDISNAEHTLQGMVASRGKITELMSSLGIASSDNIVIYDLKGGCDAARFWWILNIYGHENSYLLDGGIRAWHDKENSKTLNVKHRKFWPYEFANEENPNALATIAQVQDALGSSTVLLDVRSKEEFIGEILKDGASRKGRIPGSKWLDWSSSIDYKGNQKLLSKDKLEKLFRSVGLKKDDQIIVYCHSGVRSAHTTFVLTEILGYKNVSNYDGSWVEWSHNKALPIEIGITQEEQSENKMKSSLYLFIFLIVVAVIGIGIIYFRSRFNS